MNDLDRIVSLPSVGKLFVGLFTTLMVLVCLWAVWIYTIEKGAIDANNLPAYMADEADRFEGLSSGDYGNEHTDLVDDETRLRHNLGLAHVHINGQTLLFFALGVVFLFTSVSMRTKKRILLIFGASILMHAIGLTGEGFHWLFEDILAITGVVMLVIMVYMCLMIYVDLGRKKAPRSLPS